MAIVEIGIVMLGLGMILGLAIVIFLLAFVYTHLDKKLLKKFSELSNKDNESWNNITKVNEARANEARELRKRIEAIEEKLNIALQPESEAKEIAKEKIAVKARK